jgi:hypothetical protein
LLAGIDPEGAAAARICVLGAAPPRFEDTGGDAAGACARV